jgi:hypothetical protein
MTFEHADSKRMGSEEKVRGNPKVMAAACFIAVPALLLAAFLSGCGGKDQRKQQFVDGMVGLIQENQSQPEIAEEGRAAFQRYYMSGFNDLESAAAAAESFEKSNEKDRGTLQELASLEKPDDLAASIAASLEEGIVMMDKGNSIYAEELRKAPGQSAEERAAIESKGRAVMQVYLEGLGAIISSFKELSSYVKNNGLNGGEEVETWQKKFEDERRDIETALRYMQ